MIHEWHLVAASPGGRGDILVVCTCEWGEIVPLVQGVDSDDVYAKAEQLGRDHCAAMNA